MSVLEVNRAQQSTTSNAHNLNTLPSHGNGRQLHHGVLASERTSPGRTSVKRVISELQANFSKKSTAQCAFASAADKSDLSTSGETQRIAHVLHVPRPVNSKSTPVTKNMDSDTSFEKLTNCKARPNRVAIATTVSVSTCPSCGSENVTSSPSIGGARRSASFQQLHHATANANRSSCLGCVPSSVPDPVYRSQSFTYKCHDNYDSSDKMFDCDCSSCLICNKHYKKKYQQLHQQHRERENHRIRREPLKKVKKRPTRNTGMSRSFAGIDTVANHRITSDPNHCSSIWCTRTKYQPPQLTTNYRPSPYRQIRQKPSSFDFRWPPTHTKPYHERKDTHNLLAMSSSADYRFWDVEEWRAQMKREKARQKEKAVLMVVSAIGIIVFICVSYFGTLLFLRVTRLP